MRNGCNRAGNSFCWEARVRHLLLLRDWPLQTRCARALRNCVLRALALPSPARKCTGCLVSEKLKHPALEPQSWRCDQAALHSARMTSLPRQRFWARHCWCLRKIRGELGHAGRWQLTKTGGPSSEPETRANTESGRSIKLRAAKQLTESAGHTLRYASHSRLDSTQVKD